MNKHIFPLFEEAHILRAPMLIALRDYAYEYGCLLYEGMSDGIVSGCKIFTTDSTITLNRGVVRYDGKGYLITEPLTLPYMPTEVTTVFKLIFQPEYKKQGYLYREVQPVLSAEEEILKNELEICRFKLKEGARLRIKYVDFADRNTEFDTVNSIYAQFSAYESSSLSPEITRAFALEAMGYELDVIDQVFCLQALDGRAALASDVIIAYIATKLQCAFEPSENIETFKSLQTILKILKQGGRKKIGSAKNRGKTMIID